MNELTGKKVAFLATDMVEQVELTEPWRALENAGAELELVSLEAGEVQGANHHDVEADVVGGRTLTSFPSLQTDLRNAGATWVDEEVHVDNGLVTSLEPDDLPAFCAKLVEEIAEGRHDHQAQLTRAAASVS